MCPRLLVTHPNGFITFPMMAVSPHHHHTLKGFALAGEIVRFLCLGVM